MSLPTLPEDTLARVCSHLHRRDRDALRKTNRALRRTLRFGNATLWCDVFLNKYGTTPQLFPPEHELALYEYAEEGLSFGSAWETIVPESAHTPIAAVSNDGEIAYVAFGSQLRTLNDRSVISLPSRATAIGASDNAVAVAWDKAVNVYKQDSDCKLITTRPLRGHGATVRSAAFVTDKLLSTGADDGAVRLHDVKSRRTRGVLRAHSGAVVQQQVMSENILLTRGGERVVAWDMKTQRATRTFAGGHFAAVKNGAVVYALAPGDGCSLRVYDVRQAGVAAFLSLPRRWGRRKVGSFVLDVDGGGVVGAIGDGGIAHWPASGRWEARALADPLRRDPVRQPVICIRGGAAVTAAAGAKCEIVSAALDGPCVIKVPWPNRDGGAFTQLLPIGRRLLACRQREALLFDHRKKDASIELLRVSHAVAGSKRVINDGTSRGRFWQDGSGSSSNSSTEDSDESDGVR